MNCIYCNNSSQIKLFDGGTVPCIACQSEEVEEQIDNTQNYLEAKSQGYIEGQWDAIYTILRSLTSGYRTKIIKRINERFQT